MTTIPDFQADGLLPPGDYEVSFAELRQSILVVGPGNPSKWPNWDAAWRATLVANLEKLTRQLWQVGITEVFADGSFCRGQGPSERHRRVFRVRPGSPEERRVDTRTQPSGPRQGLDMGPVVAQAVSRVSEEAASDVAPLPRRTVSARPEVGLRQRYPRQARP